MAVYELHIFPDEILVVRHNFEKKLLVVEFLPHQAPEHIPECPTIAWINWGFDRYLRFLGTAVCPKVKHNLALFFGKICFQGCYESKIVQQATLQDFPGKLRVWYRQILLFLRRYSQGSYLTDYFRKQLKLSLMYFWNSGVQYGNGIRSASQDAWLPEGCLDLTAVSIS